MVLMLDRRGVGGPQPKPPMMEKKSVLTLTFFLYSNQNLL